MVCLFTLFSVQTHGEGKLRKRFSRFLPFVAPKARKLEKKRKTQLVKMATSLSDLELAVLDMELKGHADDIEIVDEMALMAREEIYRRIGGDEQAKILDMLAPSLKARLGSILSNPKTAPHFFATFQDAARGDLPEKYRSILQEFLSANTEDIMALNPNPKQLQGMIEATQPIDASIKILQEVLDRGEGVNEFFATFNAVAWPSPSEEYRKALNQFFKDNTDALAELPFSTKQAERIDRYVYYLETSIVLLKGGLKQARGDANKFFALFDTIANVGPPPSNEYKKILNKFFIDNTDALAELPFSTEQAKRIDRYVYHISTSIVLLKGGLKQARGDANKFFALFNTIAASDPSPSKEARDSFSKFFMDNAEKIMNLGPSLEQIKELNNYIGRFSTSLKILELALARAEYAGDFFNVFHIITENSPKNSQHIYGHFLTDHANTIVDLGPSPDQMEKISKYISSPEILFDMAKNQKKREVCAVNTAILLSLGHLPENTE